MKYILLAVTLFLSILSCVAAYIRPSLEQASGKPPIVWASDDNPRRRFQIDLFNQASRAYELRLDANNNSSDKVFIQSMAGVGPHGFDSGRWMLIELSKAGMLLDITDALATRGITPDQFWPTALDSMTVNGRIVGVPGNAWGDGLWYHKDLFDEIGLPYPPESGLTWDQFLEIGAKLTRRDSNGRITRYAIMNLQVGAIFVSNGARMFTPDGRKCVIDSPEGIDALQKFVDLQHKYKLMPTPDEEASLGTSGGWGSGPITFFKDKRTAMAAGGRWWLCTLRDNKDANGMFTLKLGVAEPPTTRFRRFRTGARVVYANALAPDRDRVIDFMVYLGQDQYNDQINLDADAMPGLVRAATRPSYFSNPSGLAEGDGGSSPVWPSLLEHGVSDEVSPYINGSRVEQIMAKHVGLARELKKSPTQALKDVAEQVNAEIALNVSRSPQLARQFEQSDGKPVFNNPIFLESSP